MARFEDEADIRWPLGAALGLIAFPALSFILGQGVLLAGGRLVPMVAGVLLVAAAGLSLAGVARVSRSWTAPLAVLVLAAIGIGGCLLFFDRSYDGQGYHFDAVYALGQGWNPLKDGPVKDDLNGLVTYDALYPTFYPKAGWVSAALQVAVGLPAGGSKNQGFMVAAAVLFAAYATGRAFGLDWRKAAAVALLAAVNPIAMVQLFSRMNDGMMGECFLLTAMLSALWLKTRNGWAMAGAALSMIFAVNLKFSGIPLFVGLSGLIVVGAVFAQGLKGAIRVAIPLFLAGLIGVLAVGFHPYVTNLRDYGHPFHPIMGEHPVDIITGNRPPAFNQESWGERLVNSYFGPTSGYEHNPRPKVPFTFSKDEISQSGGYDGRSGGFGVLFSGVLVSAAALAAAILLQRRRPRLSSAALACAGGVLALSLVMPENWWARYVPQVWYVPVLIAAAALASNGRNRQIAAYALGLLMLADAGISTLISLGYGVADGIGIRRQIADIAADPRPLCVNSGASHERAAMILARTRTIHFSTKPIAGCTTKLWGVMGWEPGEGVYCPCVQITPAAASASISPAPNP